MRSLDREKIGCGDRALRNSIPNILVSYQGVLQNKFRFWASRFTKIFIHISIYDLFFLSQLLDILFFDQQWLRPRVVPTAFRAR